MSDFDNSLNFNITDTFESGVGDANILQAVLGDESVTAKPDAVTDITDDTTTKATPPPNATKKTEETVDDKKDDSKQPNPLASFLGDDDSESEENEDDDDSQLDTKDKKTSDDVSHETNKSTDDDDKAPSQFEALAKDLVKLNVFSLDEDEEDINISTPEEFLERFNKEKQKGANELINNFLSQFGEDYQNAFQAIFVKGVDPKSYFGAYNQIVDFTQMDLKEESNQVSVVRQSLEDQGWEKEDIDAEVERLKNYGDLEAVATRNHKVLVKKQATKLQEMEQRSQLEQQQKLQEKQMYENNVSSILQEKLKTKEFDGIPINPKLASKVHDLLVTDRYKTASGEILTEFDKRIIDLKKPENHATKVKVGLLLALLEEDPSLSTIQKSGISKKTDKLFSEVARYGDKTKSNKQQSTQSSSWFVK